MKKNAIIITAAAVFTIIGIIFIFFANRSQNGQIFKGTNSQNAILNLESKIDEQSSVSVTVQPVGASFQSSEWKFDIAMNTHAVELDQDLVRSSVLIDDQGKEYKPLKWEGPTGGHHINGVLVFSPIVSDPKSIKLRISGIGGVVRNFIWQLK